MGALSQPGERRAKPALPPPRPAAAVAAAAWPLSNAACNSTRSHDLKLDGKFPTSISMIWKCWQACRKMASCLAVGGRPVLQRHVQLDCCHRCRWCGLERCQRPVVPAPQAAQELVASSPGCGPFIGLLEVYWMRRGCACYRGGQKQSQSGSGQQGGGMPLA